MSSASKHRTFGFEKTNPSRGDEEELLTMKSITQIVYTINGNIMKGFINFSKAISESSARSKFTLRNCTIFSGEYNFLTVKNNMMKSPHVLIKEGKIDQGKFLLEKLPIRDNKNTEDVKSSETIPDTEKLSFTNKKMAYVELKKAAIARHRLVDSYNKAIYDTEREIGTIMDQLTTEQMMEVLVEAGGTTKVDMIARCYLYRTNYSGDFWEQLNEARARYLAAQANV